MSTLRTTEQDWRTGKSLHQCNLFMLKNRIACDVTFLLGEEEEEVHAHKLILLSRSPVFYAMFCGPMAEKQSGIPIPDIEPNIFEKLLRYMYCDEATFDRVTVLWVLYAAKKYAVDALIKICNKFISENINVRNSCLFLHHSNRLDEHDVFRECLVFILKNGEDCLKSDAFCEMDRLCVEKVIEADDLKANELNVWEALVRWAEAECGRQEVEVNGPSIRQAMGDLVYSIRFRGIAPDIMAKYITPKEILTVTEETGLLKFCLEGIEKFEKFSVKTSRLAEQYFRVIRLADRLNSHQGWPCCGHPQELYFSVSAPVELQGVVLYSSRLCESLYEIHITLHNTSGQLLMSDQHTVDTSPHNRTFDYIFSRSVNLEKGTCYRICAQITGDMSYYGAEGKSSVTKENVTFTFQNVPGTEYGTNVVFGQIPGFLFKTAASEV